MFQVCFAHMGLFISRLRLRFEYENSNGRVRSIDVDYLTGLIETEEDDWLYDCFNIKEVCLILLLYEILLTVLHSTCNITL